MTDHKWINIPVLRFPEFSGVWEMKKIGDVVYSKSKKYNPERERVSFNCIELEHLTSETGQLLGFVDSIDSGSIKNKFEKGDILFGKLRPYLRKYLKAPFDGVCSSEIWVLKGIEISNEFLFYLVQTNAFVELANQSSGSKMPRADWNVVSSGVFAFPNLSEQSKIASFLTAVDDKICQLKKKKTLLEQYKKGLMQKIFSREIRFKDDDGKDFPDWEEKKLGEITNSISSGKSKISDEVGSYPLYGSTGIIGYSNQYEYNGRSILIARVGANAGSLYQVDGQYSVTDNTLILNLNPIVNIDYLYYMLVNININKLVFGSGQPLITGGQLKGLHVKLPTSPEQTKIANLLSAIDDKINHTTNQIEKTQQWKKGLLQQMFC